MRQGSSCMGRIWCGSVGLRGQSHAWQPSSDWLHWLPAVEGLPSGSKPRPSLYSTTTQVHFAVTFRRRGRSERKAHPPRCIRESRDRAGVPNLLSSVLTARHTVTRTDQALESLLSSFSNASFLHSPHQLIRHNRKSRRPSLHSRQATAYRISQSRRIVTALPLWPYRTRHDSPRARRKALFRTEPITCSAITMADEPTTTPQLEAPVRTSLSEVSSEIMSLSVDQVAAAAPAETEPTRTCHHPALTVSDVLHVLVATEKLIALTRSGIHADDQLRSR